MSDEKNSLVRRALESSLETGLKGLAAEAETVMLLIDTSGSMGGTPIANLSKVVDRIQAQGHVPMIAFGGPYDAQVRFVDRVPEADGGTPLHLAIPMAKTYGANRLVVISDGMPDLTEQSRLEAQNFGGKIDVIFIGRPGDSGSTFLNDLARMTGGRRIEADVADVLKLTSMVAGLLEGEVEKRAPITGPGFTSEAPDPVGTEPESDDDFEDENDDDEEEDDDADDDTDE